MQSENLQSDFKAWWQVTTTAFVMLASYVCAWLVLENYGFLYSLLFVPFIGIMGTRTFILYHDCIHNNLFSFWKTNLLVGKFLSHLVATPNLVWGGNHLFHHSHFGKISAMGKGDIPFATPKQYKRLSSSSKFLMRILRSPFICILMPIMYHVAMRRPSWTVDSEFTSTTNHPKEKVRGDLKKHLVVEFLLLLSFAVFNPLLPFIYIFSVYITWSIGFILFYLQHQHEGTVWKSKSEWEHADSALRGSSYIVLNPVVEYFVASINYHHVHHWDSSIPNYSLKKVHEERFKDDDRIYRIDSLEKLLDCFNNKMWDPKEKTWIKEFPNV